MAKHFKITFFLCVALLATALSALEVPDAPSKFWTKTTTALVLTDGAFHMADGIASHQAGIVGFTETDPIARVFLKHGVAGEATYFASTLAVDVFASYLLHKTGHHKLEHLPFLIGITFSAYGAAWTSEQLAARRSD